MSNENPKPSNRAPAPVSPPIPPRSERVRMIGDRTVVVLGVMLVVGAGAILWNLSRLSDRLIESGALQYATILSSALTEFRTLYTSEVVSVAEAAGIEVTHDYALRDGAIPLPATLSMILGNRIDRDPRGARARLYSPYPFPRRRDTGGLSDDFARAAWTRLTANPDDSFVRISSDGGASVLRFATADVMRAECVGCHNAHPETPKSDWKNGDVRGVLEVTIPMDRAITQAGVMLRETVVLVGALILLAIVGLVVMVNRLRTDAATRHRLQEERANLLARALSGFIPICSWCKKIRDRGSNWIPLVQYLALHTEAEFTHGMCTECSKNLLGAGTGGGPSTV